LEADHTKLSEKAKESERVLELVTPHVDWNAVQGRQAPATEKPSSDEEYDFISKKEHEEAIRRIESKTDIRLLEMQFRSNHPELRDYEDRLVGPAIVRLRRTQPHLTPEQLVEKAAEDANAFLEAERAKVVAEQEKATAAAEEERKQKEVSAAKASGLGSAGVTTPKAEEKAGETAEEYIARRQERNRRLRGIR